MKGYLLIKARPGRKEEAIKKITQMKLDGVTVERVSGDRDFDFIVTITDEESLQSYFRKVIAITGLESVEQTNRLRVS